MVDMNKILFQSRVALISCQDIVPVMGELDCCLKFSAHPKEYHVVVDHPNVKIKSHAHSVY